MTDGEAPQQSHPQDSRGDGSVADRFWWYRELRPPEPPVARDRRRDTRRQLILDGLACLSVATLCFSQARHELLFASWGFYSYAPLGAHALAALLLSIVGLAAVGFLVVRAMRRSRRRVGHRLAAVVAAAMLLIALNYARITYESLDRWTDSIGRSWLVGLTVLMLAASVAWPDRARRLIRSAALLVSPLAVLTLGQTLWMFLEVAAGPVWRWVDPAPLGRTPPSLRRVVWLVFEELDQRIAFEARPTGLDLPELDRLRRESLYADAARPPAGASEVSMPALITGRPVVAVAQLSPNDLELTFSDGKAARWSAYPNVFARARAMGYDTAVIGWQLPYPRVLGAAFGVAHWRPSDRHEQARGDTFGQTLVNQWGSLVPPANVRRLVSQRTGELGELAVRTAADSRFGLVLLHLPVPRPPGIYDRATGRLTMWNFAGPAEGYLDNLALADRMLAELRRALLRGGLGDRTWLVVSAPHGWAAAKRHDGQVDHRVPFLVRPPDGGRATHVDAPFNTLATHDLMLAILRGSVRDTDDAAAWLARNPSVPPRDYTSGGRPIY